MVEQASAVSYVLKNKVYIRCKITRPKDFSVPREEFLLRLTKSPLVVIRGTCYSVIVFNSYPYFRLFLVIVGLFCLVKNRRIITLVGANHYLVGLFDLYIGIGVTCQD